MTSHGRLDIRTMGTPMREVTVSTSPTATVAIPVTSMTTASIEPASKNPTL